MLALPLCARCSPRPTPALPSPSGFRGGSPPGPAGRAFVYGSSSPPQAAGELDPAAWAASAPDQSASRPTETGTPPPSAQMSCSSWAAKCPAELRLVDAGVCGVAPHRGRGECAPPTPTTRAPGFDIRARGRRCGLRLLHAGRAAGAVAWYAIRPWRPGRHGRPPTSLPSCAPSRPRRLDREPPAGPGATSTQASRSRGYLASATASRP
jgi:hypothetical protein